MWRSHYTAFFVVVYLIFTCINCGEIDPASSVVWGPGLSPDLIVMPARYFFIHAMDSNKTRFQSSQGDVFSVDITGDSEFKYCRVWVNILDRKDGSYIVRYKLYHTCLNLKISVKYKGRNVASSPYTFKGPIFAEDCYCPVESISEWLTKFGCQREYEQITEDLKPFPNVNLTEVRRSILKKYDSPGSTSLCNYVIKDNEIYRKCYGKYVGFKMFMDAILLSLARKVVLPDLEFFMNLGDWPLVSTEKGPKVPVFSWCGSDDTMDIVLPTYDITEATLECMGRVMLDMLSVQGNIDKKWEDKIEKAFWRGRDSRRERLKLIEIARKNPDLFNASLTNFFFFKEEEKEYGPKEKHVSFFKFFDYKYQINIDGTVAAYRFPYLLAGDSLVFKQDSKYYEHFYNQLEAWKHYIPLDADLSNIVEQIIWAKKHDAAARAIAERGQQFARSNLMPQDIFCYHATLLKNWSHRVISEVKVLDGMEHVPQPVPDKPHEDCQCDKLSAKQSQGDDKDLRNKEEL
ncbi:protein O-glucosyltransferase 2-like [Schistocerca americana]|uniref:protein O-glucosyltransferase 2-like n=1 Tax=Schistocerca americana TaxID=7009 RepID=UPI001F4FA304|nr:protein O-glucosyltransferase 2-like [Schistocerca americana]